MLLICFKERESNILPLTIEQITPILSNTLVFFYALRFCRSISFLLSYIIYFRVILTVNLDNKTHLIPPQI